MSFSFNEYEEDADAVVSVEGEDCTVCFDLCLTCAHEFFAERWNEGLKKRGD